MLADLQLPIGVVVVCGCDCCLCSGWFAAKGVVATIMTTIVLPYTPQPRQVLLHASKARQTLYGGAAGGGKSHAIRWDAISMCLQNPNLQAFLFRRTLKELEGTHIRPTQREIPPELGDYKDGKKRFDFYNGSSINFCYCEHENDVENYLSEEMHWLGIDEASRFTPSQIAFLRTRNRLGGYKPVQTGFLPRFVMASNPGGPSHGYLRETFLNAAPPETYFYDRGLLDPANKEDKGWLSIFIPAKMADNKYLDKDYASTFGGLPPELARAYRDGDWDAVVGAALETLSRDKHCVRPFTPPKHCTHIMGIDWGTARPFSVGWYVVSDGWSVSGRGNWAEKYIPPGALVRYAEWYGWDGRSDKGCRMESPQVALRVLQMEAERSEVIDYRVGDTQMWAQSDGPSPAERMLLSTDGRFSMRQAVKDKQANYAEVIARLAGEDVEWGGKIEKLPMLYVTADCRHFWRTVPGLTLDTADPEKGPDAKQENHCYDELAYVARSRPYATTEEERWDEEGRQTRSRAKKGGDPYAVA